MESYLRALLLAVSLSACACPCATLPTTPPRAEQLPVGSRLSVFEGDEGLRITVLDLPDPMRALLHVSGRYGRASGMVMPAERLEAETYVRYTVQLDGRAVVPLAKRESAEWWSPQYEQHTLKYIEPPNAEREAQELYRKFHEQLQSGVIERVQRFDSAAAKTRVLMGFEAQAEQLTKRCGTALQARIDWAQLSDEQLMQRPIHCYDAISAIEATCLLPKVRSLLAALSAIDCRPGEEGELELTGDTLIWRNAPAGAPRPKERFLGLTLSDGRALLDHVWEEGLKVCADAKRQHFVVLSVVSSTVAGEHPAAPLSYGDGERFVRIRTSSGGGIGNKQRSASFYDPRLPEHYGRVSVDLESNRCSINCGQREVELSALDLAETRALLARARFEDPEPRRRAHALTRDRAGRYYYVDRGDTAELARDFRFYRGLRGQLTQLSLQDVTQDSKGEIYTTALGQLRLFRDPDAQWIERKVTTRLDSLPIEDNRNLIYNELGVYLGTRFNVPCDDF